MPGGPEDCVADREHIAESTGSTSQQWSTNSGTQPLTISCGFPAPCLVLRIRGPPILLMDREGPSPLSLEEPSIRGKGLSKTMLRVLRVLRPCIGN